MQTITNDRLLTMIKQTQGTAIIGLLTLIDAKARKTDNPFGPIFKQVRSVGFVGADYQKAVEREQGRQLASSGVFVAESLPWGNWLVPNKVIEHKGKLYLRTQSTPGQRRNQSARVIAYRDTQGRFLSRDEVRPFLSTPKESTKQQVAGLDATVWVRTYAFDSIQRVRLNGRTYTMAH